MPYAPVNIDAYTNAYSGALAGMAISGWIIDPTAADYSEVAAIAGAFAQAFDVVWNNAATLNWLQIQSIQSVCQGQFTGHSPGSLDNSVFALPASWAVPAAACAALVLQGDAFVTSEGIVPNTPGSGGAAALSTYWFVDSASVAPAPDGSLAKPFATIAAAMAAAVLATITNLTLVMAPGSYLTTNIDFNPGAMIKLTLSTPGMGNSTNSDNSVNIADGTWTPLAGGGSELVLQGININGVFTSVDAAAPNSRITVDASRVGVFNSSGNTQVFASNRSEVYGDNTTQAEGVVSRSSTVHVGIIGALGIDAWDSDISFVSVTGDTRMVGCDIIPNPLDMTFAGGAQVNIWSGCTFNTTPNIIFTAPGLLHLDGQTNYWHTAASGGLTNGQIIVTERPQQALIVVAVPALAAGVLDYVDVSTVATPLAGLQTTDLVGYNPVEDVEAAGAGIGGPTYVRVSAADTIRVTFIGTTTGHNVGFNFFKLS